MLPALLKESNYSKGSGIVESILCNVPVVEVLLAKFLSLSLFLFFFFLFLASQHVIRKGNEIKIATETQVTFCQSNTTGWCSSEIKRTINLLGRVDTVAC